MRIVSYFLGGLFVAGLVGVPTWAQERNQEKEGPMTLGVILYPGFEPLDVFGPVEMFMNVPLDKLTIVMIARDAGLVASTSGASPQAYNGPKVMADYGFDDAPHLDLILLPGGFGTFPALQDEKLLQFLRERAEKAQITTSVCSGSALLAKAGLLDGRKATCNKAFYDMLTAQGPNVEWVPRARWVDDGDIVTSSGVSAGIDMALAVIERLWGTEMAESIATGTEYVWNRNPDDDPFAKD